MQNFHKKQPTQLGSPGMTLMLCAALLPASAFAQGTPSGKLNDTGQTTCDNGSNVMVSCTTSNTGDTGNTMPRQDARFGRDPKAAAGTLVKIGAGTAGFDFTRVCMSGVLAGVGSCPGNSAVAVNQAAPTANEWACTKDNNTNLIWSLQSGFGDWTTYATATLPATTNTATRCGFSTGWRLPTRRELLTIVHNGTSSPSIDTAYFPGTSNAGYWSVNTFAPDAAMAIPVDFSVGHSGANVKTFSYYVRLVRSGE